MGTPASGKVKIARRFVEVLDYFDSDDREATIMDIARRYGRPQSSTSELIYELVDLGFLYRNPGRRTYSLSPRAAFMSTAGQADILRDGRLIRMVDQASADTGLAIGIFGMTGLSSQALLWRSGTRAKVAGHSGMQQPLSRSAAGWLLLSTMDKARRDGIIRRLNAEAIESDRRSHAEIDAGIEEGFKLGYLRGHAGFDKNAEQVGVMLPRMTQPIVIAASYRGAAAIDPQSLAEYLVGLCQSKCTV